MLTTDDARRVQAIQKAKRNAAARARRMRQRGEVASWTPRWLRCGSCGRWTGQGQVTGYGAGRVWCEPCALAADLARCRGAAAVGDVAPEERRAA